MREPHPKADYTVVAATQYVAVDGDMYPETQPQPLGEGGSSTMAFARHPYGAMGRANDPDVDSSGEVVNGAHLRTEREGSTLHTESLDDPRVTRLLPQLPKGGHQTYGAQPNEADTRSYAQHDGQGNYTVVIPASSKSLTLKTEDGELLVRIADGVVKVGDENAEALAYARGISDLQEVLNSWTPVSNDGGASLKALLTKWIITPYATTKAQGT